MFRCLFLLALSGVAFAQTEYDIISFTGDLRLSFVSSPTDTGNFQLKWTLPATDNRVSATKYIGVGFQNNVDANSTTADLNMGGPYGGGSDCFIVTGSTSSPWGMFRTLNRSSVPMNSRGSQPTLVQALQGGSTPPQDARVRSVMATTVGNVKTYTMTVSCAPGGGWTNLAWPSVMGFAFGDFDAASGVDTGLQKHAASPMGRGWRRQTSSSSSDLIQFRLCGSNAGIINPPPTMAPTSMTTTRGSGIATNPLSILSLLVIALASVFAMGI